MNYAKNQMSSFFICGDDWEKQREITYEDMDTDSDQDVWLMDECVLSDYLDDEGQKLLFVFDYMTDRALYMELRGIQTGVNLSEPLCTLSLGQAPAQTVDIGGHGRHQRPRRELLRFGELFRRRVRSRELQRPRHRLNRQSTGSGGEQLPLPRRCFSKR